MNNPDNLKKIHDKLFRLLIKSDDIQDKVVELANKISIDYKHKNILLICVLKGAFIFFADLIKCLNLQDLCIDFIQISSYKGKTDKSEISLLKDITTDITAKNVILIEDIIDTGNSVKFLKQHLLLKNPNSLKICTLINKIERRNYKTEIEYIGYNLDNGFVVGYGMDYMEYGRNFKDIYILVD